MGIGTRGVIWSVLLASACWPGFSQTLAHKGWAGSDMRIAPWWESAILYQIDPVSFQDSGEDGFGDLRGIAERLDYLETLGVDGIVIAPLQPGGAGAQAGAGQPFDPVYGSSEDLDELVREAGARKMRIFADVPLGEAISLPETLNVARFWLSRGVAGLRLTLDPAESASRAQLGDRVRALKRLSASYPGQRVLFWDVREPVRAGEAAGARRSYARHHATRRAGTYGPGITSGAGMAEMPQMVMDFGFERMPRLDAAALRGVLGELSRKAAIAGPTGVVAIGVVATGVIATGVVATDGGEMARSLDRFGGGAHELELARVLAAALLLVPELPLLYFGQEIGMATTPAPSGSGASQPAAGDPTPMQWGDARGFSSGAPWLAMGRNAGTANVAMEDADRFSLLNWYRRLGALRHSNAALREGAMEVLNVPDPAVVAWVRRAGSKEAASAAVVVVCNVSDHPVAVSVAAELGRLGLGAGNGIMRTLAASETPAAALGADQGAEQDAAPVSIRSVALPAYGVYVGELRGAAGLEAAPAAVRPRRRR